MSKKPHIVFVIPHGVQLFYPELRHRQGGSEVQLTFLARELARRGEVQPVALLGAYGQPVMDEVDGVRLLSFAHQPGISGRISLWRALERSRPAVIIQRGSGSMTANVAIYHLLRRVPFIYWVAYDPDCAPDAIPGFSDPLRTRSFEWGLRRANAIITQHDGQAELLKRHLGRDPIAVIPNGWPSQTYPPENREFHLWVGNATERKNPDALLEIAKTLSDQKFLMIMPPEGSDPAVELRVNKRLKELPNVECRGRVPFAEMHNLFSHAKTLIMTSRAEGFPNTMLQALWNGLPILSLTVDPGGLLMRNGLGWNTKGNIVELIKLLGDLANDHIQWEEYSRRAYTYATVELSLVSVADRFMDVLHKMDLA